MRSCLGSRAALLLLLLLARPLIPPVSLAHDIPNARVDRSIQVLLEPSRVVVEYEVLLAEMTLAQDLRQFDGESFVGGRQALFERYSTVVGPLNARGLLVKVDGVEIDLRQVGSSVLVDDHARLRFSYHATLPLAGRLVLTDTNYASAEGSVRLGLRTAPSLEVVGESPPADVESIPWLPSWRLTEDDKRRAGRLDLTFRVRTPIEADPSPALPPRVKGAELPPRATGLTRLLDEATGARWAGWLVVALALGMIHALQPGHGKMLMAAAGLGTPDAAWRGIRLGLVTAICHLVGVVLLAALLWTCRTDRYEPIDLALTRGAGFLVAAVGFFRVGRHLAGIGVDHHDQAGTTRGIWSLGLAAGFVPCWDAVALLVVAHSIGRLGWGLALLVAFSLGSGIVLVGVGWSAGCLGERASLGRRFGSARRGLGLASGLALAAIGLNLLGR